MRRMTIEGFQGTEKPDPRSIHLNRQYLRNRRKHRYSRGANVSENRLFLMGKRSCAYARRHEWRWAGNPIIQHGYWSGREDLNLRPPQPHCGALPDCATPRSVFDPRRFYPGDLNKGSERGGHHTRVERSYKLRFNTERLTAFK